jgi:hypothetical protein
MTWHRDFTSNMQKFPRLTTEAEKGYVVDAGEMFPEDDHFPSIAFYLC